MGKSKPPARSTAGRGRRLRSSFATSAVAVLAAFAASAAAQALAKGSPLKVLVAATVSDRALPSMPQKLWTKYVDAYVAESVVPFDGATDPTLEDCRKAGADYVIVAPFDLRPRLPGMPNSSGRIAARAHLVVTNCITGNLVVDQSVNIDSDPPSTANEGDFESVPEITWSHAVPAALAKNPIVFERVAHITNLNTPFAFVDLKASSHVGVGDALRDFATADHANRAHPIVLTVTAVFEKYVQVAFSSISGDLPALGDLVEPIAKNPAAIASPTP